MEMMMGMMASQGDPNMILNLFMFVIGLAMHVGHSMFEHKVSFSEYMLNHGGRTLLSMGSLIGAFVSATALMPEAPMMSYLMAGYMINSLANKAPVAKLEK